MPRAILAAGFFSLLALLSGCITWQTDQRGNLRSVGLPGVPVWKAATDTAKLQLEPDGPGSAPWLLELNHWRQLAGVGPVGENLALSQGSEQHARYLIEQGPENPEDFVLYAARLGPQAHTEDPANPLFTQTGLSAARGGPIDIGIKQGANVAWQGKTPQDFVDQLIIAPFHRLSLLAPWAKVAGFGSYGSYPRNAAAIAVRGMASNGPATEVEFPPSGAAIPMGAMTRYEWPNPLAACPDYRLPIGLPITLQMGSNTSVSLESFSVLDETTGQKLESCAFDAGTYSNVNFQDQQHGRQVLLEYGAIIVIPRHPLQAGDRYKVAINANQRTIAWSFTVSGEPTQASPPSAANY